MAAGAAPTSFLLETAQLSWEPCVKTHKRPGIIIVTIIIVIIACKPCMTDLGGGVRFLFPVPTNIGMIIIKKNYVLENMHPALPYVF